MKKRLPIIIIAVLVVVFAGLGFYSHQKSKIKYNTSYVNGNTAGNLYNAGLFCEKNGTVYFANPDVEIITLHSLPAVHTTPWQITCLRRSMWMHCFWSMTMKDPVVLHRLQKCLRTKKLYLV